MTNDQGTGSDQLLAEAMRRLRGAKERIAELESAAHEPVAIFGMGLRMPGDATTPNGFWEFLSSGRDGVEPFVATQDGRRDESDQNPDGWAGALRHVDSFDADFFGIPPAEAERMDPQQRLVLEVAWEAIEDAGVPVERLRDKTTGVYLGVYGHDYLGMQLAEPDRINAYTGPGTANSIVANRLSYLLDLAGPSLAVDTACSSSLVALHLAMSGLRNGECDFALVGGVNLILSPLSTIATGKTLPLSPSGRCHTFDAGADGIVRSEGCGMLLLARARDVEETGARALIMGSAVNSDGRTNGLTAPNPSAQREVMRRALADARVDADGVGYVEAHGTGTPLGDPLEVEAIREVYGVGRMPCALGALKANLGHLEAAAGIAGVLKAVLALQHGEVPGASRLGSLNPEIDLVGSRLVVPTEPHVLPDNPEERYAAVSSFGFGGTNAHVVLKAATPVERQAASHPEHLLLPISARDPSALRVLAEEYADRLVPMDHATAAKLCTAAAVRRTHHRVRACVTASDPAALRRELAATTPARAADDPRVGFVFCGQGSQWLGMGRDLSAIGEAGSKELAACDEVVREIVGWSPVALLGSDELPLENTEYAQILICVVQLAVVAQLREWDIVPDAVVGHSMGEVTAARVAGALDRKSAFELLLRRARVSERAARGGAMATLALGESDTQPRLSGRVGIGAVNGPRSTAVAGDRAAVADVLARAEADGVRGRMLPVDYGFHSPLLDGAEVELAEQLTWLEPVDGEVAFYSTVTGERASTSTLDAKYWGRNLRETVRLARAIRSLAADGIDVLVEIGPRPVLLGDIRDTIATGNQVTLASVRRGQPALAGLHATVAGLYEAGCDPAWEQIVPQMSGPLDLPLYPWRRKRYWLPWLTEASTADPPPEERDASWAATVRAAEPARREELLADYIRARVATMLRVTDVDEIAVDTPLELLGLDSVAVVELKNLAERDLAMAVPLTELIEGGSARRIAGAIARGLSTETSPRAGVNGEQAASLLADLDGLSDDEVEAALDVLEEDRARD